MQTTTYTPKQIVAQGCEPKSRAITVAGSQTLAAGTLMGVTTADGLGYAWDPTATDGTESLVGILTDRVDTSDAGEALLASVYFAHGILYLDQLVGLTGNEGAARNDIGMRIFTSANLVVI